ncbi:hypothetical protein LHP98_06575 [Rhodobacter sp. Har01]|uniref:hypothetical protein n=1 Tax=Rhodobacter sp. Har01 TaxID=2883999 RepID=UPI001D08E73B|nr:hypothetical protein [Rhodobacter sp. Har01]MCB6177795.1 hypothetical protein [Rhodobacter sp. Har01]
MILTRRLALTVGLWPLMPLQVRAAADSAEVVAAAGGAVATLPDATVIALRPGQRLPAGSSLDTGPEGPVELALPDGTRLHAGRQTQMALQVVTHDRGGSLAVSGTLVVDRRASDPASVMAVNSAEFQVLLADAQVFIESLKGSAVFVRDGKARVVAPATEVVLAAGEGIDLPSPFPLQPGAAILPEADPSDGLLAPAPALPPAVARWSDNRVAEAFASVGLSA